MDKFDYIEIKNLKNLLKELKISQEMEKYIYNTISCIYKLLLYFH